MVGFIALLTITKPNVDSQASRFTSVDLSFMLKFLGRGKIQKFKVFRKINSSTCGQGNTSLNENLLPTFALM